MNRSAGIVASAVIAIIGSLLCLAAALFMLVFTPPPLPNQPPPPAAVGVTIGFIATFYSAFGIWGIVSAIGLLKLRNWARLCFIAFGGLLCLFAVFLMFGMLMLAFFMPQAPAPNVSPQLIKRIFAVMGTSMLLPAGLGVWWMIYFNRSRIKLQFMSEAKASEARQFPVGVTVIAGFLILGGASIFISSMGTFPLLLFGFIVRGYAARAVLIAWGFIGLFAGIGILKKHPAAYSFAIGYFVFGLLNSIVYWAVPGSAARMLDAMREMPGGQTMASNLVNAPFKPFIFLTSALMAFVVWYLIKKRRAFLEWGRGV